MGGLGDNPALLGFAPSFTVASEAQVATPGVAGAQDQLDEWYDDESKKLSIRLDFSSEEKAEQTMAEIDQVLGAFNGIEGRGMAGLSVGRVGLGTTASGFTRVVNSSRFDPEADNEAGFSANLDATFSAVERADVVLAVGAPVGTALAWGAAVKVSRFFAEELVVEATAEEIEEDSTAADPQSTYEVGSGVLVDAGLALNLKYFQVDVALKDIGNVEWRAEQPPWDDAATVGPVRQHDKPVHIAGGVVLKPFGCLDLSARCEKSVLGNSILRTEAVWRPVRWLTLKGGQVAVDDQPVYYTAGGGVRLWMFGLDGGIAVRDRTVVGGRARLSVGF